MTSENPSGQQKPGRMTEMTLMAQLLTSLSAGFNWLLADSLTLGLRQVPDVPTAPKPL